ncbi:mannose-6-phosphate isomerase, class I [Actinomyces vulturis]|uniref:mannose-6-phosphate isomerase, class I n=1 Tax=Actinomyces vulturis TaxID=1857645 RepID=UPI00082F720E|nr:mannose-6-phosphate isomerase, class I [Actinomyces vulturis]
MLRLTGALQRYDWGSPTVMPSFLGVPADDKPWAELWFGAHPAGPTMVVPQGCEHRIFCELEETFSSEAESHLASIIGDDPVGQLGSDVVERFGEKLPFLLKVITPGRPLSLQVHPDSARAAQMFKAEDDAGIDRLAPERSYKDANHKPEMVLALTHYEAVAGFRAPRRAGEVLAGLDCEVAESMRKTLRRNPTRFGIRQVFTEVVSDETKPSPGQIEELVNAVRVRQQAGLSPSPRVDANVVAMNEAFPGDPGVAASLLLNPVTLQPGEALFVPAGAVHAYISGLGIEVMASSDNVLRAGLTTKHVDVDEMLACVDYVAAPPVRPAPEYISSVTRAYYAPVDDFDVLVTTVRRGDGRVQVMGHGPRIGIVVEGSLRLGTIGGSEELTVGQAVFIPAFERALSVEGEGVLVQAECP